MADLEPFKYQASTNLKEHNDIVNKVNEIVGVINDINLDGLDPRLTADEQNIAKNTADINQLKISDNKHTAEISTLESNVDNHAREITAIKAVDAKQTSDISEINTVVDALTKELPTEITLYRDGEGKIKAQVTKEDNTTFDSNTLDMIIPYQYDIISGTSARSFKLDITTSDGNHIVTNDFLIPEGGGTDVTITSVTLQKDPNNANKVKVSIGLSDGSPLESGYVTMVNSVSGSFANNKLTITVNGVSSSGITIDTTGQVYTEGTGIKIASGTISVDNTVVAFKADISDMETKTNANATFETKANAKATYATKSEVNDVNISLDDAIYWVNLGSDNASLDFETIGGDIISVNIPTGETPLTDEWEMIDLTNFPSDWTAGTYIKMYPNFKAKVTSVPSSWSGSLTNIPLSIEATAHTAQELVSPEIIALLSLTYTEIGYNTVLYDNYGFNYRIGLNYVNLNSDSPARIALTIIMFNGSGTKQVSKYISKDEIQNYFSAIYRKKE